MSIITTPRQLDHPRNTAYATAVRTARRRMGHGLASIAAELGISVTMFSAIERGVIAPSPQLARDIQQVLGVAAPKE